MEATAIVVCEISTRKVKSNLAFLLTLSISGPFSVQTPVFEKMLLKSGRRITHDLEAVALVVREISTGKLKSNLAFVRTLNISITLVLVQKQDFEKMLLSSRQRNYI